MIRIGGRVRYSSPIRILITAYPFRDAERHGQHSLGATHEQLPLIWQTGPQNRRGPRPIGRIVSHITHRFDMGAVSRLAISLKQIWM